VFVCSLYYQFNAFFFQAEDGIRDRDVTGVQTCALPIFVIVTDGLTDQIGSHNGKRAAYGHRRLEALLMKHHKENATDIAKHLQEDFARWQGNEPRRDDVTVVIFKL